MEYWIHEMEMKNDEIWQAMGSIDLNQEYLWFGRPEVNPSFETNLLRGLRKP